MTSENLGPGGPGSFAHVEHGTGGHPSDNGAGKANPDARRVHAAVREIMLAAADDPVMSERLAISDARVACHFADARPLALTLLLDRNPIEVVDREDPDADVHIYANTREWDRYWSGEYMMPMGIIRGEVTYSGPVSRFLRAMPIMRRLAGEFRQIMNEQGGPAPSRGDSYPDSREVDR